MMPSVGSTTVVYLPENCCKILVKPSSKSIKTHYWKIAEIRVNSSKILLTNQYFYDVLAIQAFQEIINITDKPIPLIKCD